MGYFRPVNEEEEKILSLGASGARRAERRDWTARQQEALSLAEPAGPASGPVDLYNLRQFGDVFVPVADDPVAPEAVSGAAPAAPAAPAVTDQMINSVRNAVGKRHLDPDQFAEASRIAIENGISPNIALSNNGIMLLDKLKRKDKGGGRAFETTASARWIAQNGALNQTFDDTENMARAEGIIGSLTNSYAYGRSMKELAQWVSRNVMAPGGMSLDVMRRSYQYRELVNNFERHATAREGYSTSQKIFGGFAENVAQNLESYLRSAGAVGAGIAAGVAGTPISGVATGIVAGVAAKSLNFWDMAELEGGMLMVDLASRRDDNGNYLDESAVRQAAWVGGLINAAIEFGQYELLLKYIPGVGKFLKDAAKVGGKEALGIAADAAQKYGLGKFLKDFGLTLGGEVAQERLQDLTGLMAGNYAASMTNKKNGITFDTEKISDFVKETPGALGEYALSFMLSSALGPGARYAGGRLFRAREAVDLGDLVNDAAEAERDLKINTRDPKAAADYLDTLFQENGEGDRKIFVLPSVFRTFFQKDGAAVSAAGTNERGAEAEAGAAADTGEAVADEAASAGEAVAAVDEAAAAAETSAETGTAVTDAAALSGAADGAVLDFADALDKFGLTEDMIAEAEAAGMPVEMSMGQFIVGVNATGARGMIEDAAFEDDGPTVREAREDEAKSREILDNAVRDADARLTEIANLQKSAAQIEANVAAQLSAINDKLPGGMKGARMGETQFTDQARLIAKAMTTFARRAGMDPYEYFQKLGLTFSFGEVQEDGTRKVLMQRAFVGSPARFTRFSTDFIGTGEGAQAYGWGLYAAELRAIAEWYREQYSHGEQLFIDGELYEYSNGEWYPGGVSDVDVNGYPLEYNSPEALVLNMLADNGYDIEDVRAQIKDAYGLDEEDDLDSIESEYLREYIERGDDMQAALEYARNTKSVEFKDMSQLYEIEIPDKEFYLDYDNELSEMPSDVAKKVRKLFDALGLELSEDMTGKEIYDELERHYNDPESASRKLLEFGIPGIMYLDNASRMAVQGDGSTHNFVLFDGDLMEIVNTFYQQQAANIAGAFTPAVGSSGASVMLTPGANATTLLHETGHLYFWLLETEAAREGADAQSVADMEVVRRFVGAEAGAALTDEQHETLAKAYTRYVKEGIAPSSELQGVFSRFAKWLSDFWNQIKDDPTAIKNFFGGDINDEIRGVFDRLLSVDEELRDRIEAESGDELAELNELFPILDEGARADKEARARSRAIQDTMHEQTGDEKELRDAFRADAERRIFAETAREPAYAALLAMRDTERDDGLDLRFSAGDLVSRYGENILDALPDGVVAGEGGMNADEAAGWLGFRDGDQLIDALRNAGDINDEVRRRADEYMAAAFPDAEQRGDLARAIDEGLYDESSLDEVITEYIGAEERDYDLGADPRSDAQAAADANKFDRILNAEKRQGENAEMKARRDAILADAKAKRAAVLDAAIAAVSAQNWLEVRDGRNIEKYRRQKDKARRAWKEAVKARDFDKMREAKEREIRAHAMITATGNVRGSVVADLKDEKRFAHRKNETRTKTKVDAEALAQMDALMGRVGAKEVSPVELKDVKSLGEYIASVATDGGGIDIPQSIVNGYGVKDKGFMSASEYHDYVEALRALDTHGRVMKQIWIEGKKVNLEELVEKLTASINANSMALGKREQSEAIRREKKRLDNFKRRCDQMIAENLKCEFICRALDGFKRLGIVWRAIMSPMRAAQLDEAKLKDQKYKELRAAVINSYGSMENFRARIEQKKFFDGIGVAPDFHEWMYRKYQKDSTQLGDELEARYRDIYEKDILNPKYKDKGTSMTGEQIIMILLNSGNITNMDRICRGEGWSLPQGGRLGGMTGSWELNTILGSCTEADLKFAQAIWDINESLWERAAETHERVTGFKPNRVEPYAMNIRPADWEADRKGSFELRGGYFHIAYDLELTEPMRNVSERAEHDALFNGAFASAMTEHGHLKSRVEKTGYQIKLELSVITDHLDSAIHDITHRAVVIDVNKIIKHPEFKDAVTYSLGDQVYNQLRPWLLAAARGVEHGNTWFDKLQRKLKGNSQIHALGFNPGPVSMQHMGHFGGIMTLAENFQDSLFPTAKAIPIYLRYLARYYFSGWSGMTAIEHQVHEKSDFMKNRSGNLKSSMAELAKEMYGRGKWDSAMAFAMRAITGMDTIVTTPIWLANYEAAMHENGYDHDKAVKIADMAIATSQDINTPIDQSLMQRTHKMMCMFYNMMGTMFNRFHEEYWKRKAGLKSWASAWVPIIILWQIPALVNWLRLPPADDDDPEMAWARAFADFLAYDLTYPTQFLPVIREVGSSCYAVLSAVIYNKKKQQALSRAGASSPGMAAFTKLPAALFSLLSNGVLPLFDKDAEADYRDLITELNSAGGLLAGYPANSINRVVNAISDALDDTRAPSALETLRHAVFGGRAKRDSELVKEKQKRERQDKKRQDAAERFRRRE